MVREPASGICIQLTDTKMTFNDMRFLHDHFKGVPDVRRLKGREHGIANVLPLAAGATLSGMWRLQGYLGVCEHAEPGEPGTVPLPVSQPALTGSATAAVEWKR